MDQLCFFIINLSKPTKSELIPAQKYTQKKIGLKKCELIDLRYRGNKKQIPTESSQQRAEDVLFMYSTYSQSPISTIQQEILSFCKTQLTFIAIVGVTVNLHLMQ